MSTNKPASKKEKLRHLIHSYLGFQYLKYTLIGVPGFLINLAITFGLTEFLFGRPNYIYAFAIGTLVNLIYNYIVYVRYIFPTRGVAAKKKVVFFAYSLAVVFVQIALTNVLVPIAGIDFYLPVLIIVMGFITFVSYFLFKSHIFSQSA